MILKIKNLSKKYKNDIVFENLNLEIKKGEFIAIIGKNGAGKTTVLKIIAGILKNDSGEIFYNSEEISKNGNYLKKISYIPQENALLEDMTVYDNLKFFYEIANKNIKNEIDSEIFKIFEIKKILYKKVKNLSGGMKRKVSIVSALAKDPEIILLDEMSVGLDLKSKEDILRYLLSLKKRGKSVVLVSHDLDEIDICDKVYFLKNKTLEEFNGNINKEDIINNLR